MNDDNSNSAKVFGPGPSFKIGLPFGLVAGGAACIWPNAFSLKSGILAVTLVLIFFFMNWVLGKFSIILSPLYLEGPDQNAPFSRRQRIIRENIDKSKTQNRSTFAKAQNYWDVWSTNGTYIRIHCSVLGKKNTEELLTHLGLPRI